jgi:hypothetical protein
MTSTTSNGIGEHFRNQFGQQGPAVGQRHDMQEELVFLRGALDSARLEISQLKDEVTVLREKILFLKVCTPASMSQIELIPMQSKVLFVQPPFEVLQMIFSWALPPSFLLDPSLAAGPQSPWSQTLRLKKSIVRVCKTWHAVGSEFLYEDVVFRRIGQIPAFVRTLDTSTRISSNLVKKITISAYIPRRYGRSCSEQLQHIFSRCHHVYKFALASPNVLPDIVTLPIHYFRITTLEVNDAFQYHSLLPVLTQVCDTLMSLSFHPNNSGDLHTALCFPCLKSLVCDIWQSESARALAVIGSAWSMPSLKCLTFSTRSWLWTTSDKLISSETIHSFCLTHGKHLRFLLIGPGRLFSNTKMQEIMDTCPSLEHLVMRLDESLLPIAHRNIKWIDFWPSEKPQWFTDKYPWEMAVFHQADSFKAALPALRGVRILMHGLPSMFDVPMFISPSWATDKDTFSIQYPGIDIHFERGFLYNSSPIGKNGGYAAGHGKGYLGLDDSGDESDDKDYVTESGETDSSSSISDTASVSSGSSDDDVYLPEFLDSDGSMLDSDSDTTSRISCDAVIPFH